MGALLSKRAAAGAALIASLSCTVGAVSCGARSELEVDGEGAGGSPADAGVDHDATADVPPDVPPDVPEDVPPDVQPECASADTTYIYVVTSQTELLAFKPQSNSFESRGTLACPAAPNAAPFSMAVDRTGLAHVIYDDGELFRVSTLDAACEATLFQVGQQGFVTFGMGYGANQNGPGETLYVAEISFSAPSMGLARIDTDTYELSYIGPFSQNPGNALELTPTGPGPLYGYFLNTQTSGGTLAEIDTATAKILSTDPVDVGNNSSALAVAWWGGSFYIFTTPGSTSTEVTRYDPVTHTTAVVATSSLTVVGAGVSTCAPTAMP